MAEVLDVTVEILKQIRDAIGGTNERLDRVDARLQRVEARLERVEHQQIETNVRIDRLLDSMGEHWRDHEHRIRRLEEETNIRPA